MNVLANYVWNACNKMYVNIVAEEFSRYCGERVNTEMNNR